MMCEVFSVNVIDGFVLPCIFVFSQIYLPIINIK